MIITLEQLFEINSKMYKDKCAFYLAALNDVLPQYEITSKLRVCHFLAQVIHESGHFRCNKENLNYSAEGLMKTFKKYFPTKELAEQYARKPEKIANRVYANRMGNRDENSGDGSRFLGRGLIMLTGHDNYVACGKGISQDLKNKPQLLCEDPVVSVKAACWFWNSRNLNKYADADDCLMITKRINGDTIGLADRRKNLELAKKVLIC